MFKKNKFGGGLLRPKIQLLDKQSHINNDREKFYKDQFKQNTIVATIAAIALGLKVGNAVYMLSADQVTITEGMTLKVIQDYIIQHPFAVYPFAWQWLLIMIPIPVIVGLNSYMDYIKKKNTMWKDAHGSGGFEKNYPGFYREFVYDPAIIGGDVIPIGEGKKVSAKTDLVTKKDLKTRMLYELDTRLFFTKNKLITREQVAECILNSQLYSNTVMLSMNTRLTQRNLSAVILGASGAGKSRFIVKPNLLQANSSYVVTDPSGENLASTAAFLESQGYLVKVFNLKDMELSNRYNPFHYLNSDKDIPSLVTCLKNNIDSAGTGEKKNSGANKFWDDSTIALLCACVGYLYEAFTDDEPFLRDENGNKIPLKNENGQIVIMHDVDGNPLLDENGEPVIAYEPNPYWKGKRIFKNVMNMIRMSCVDESDPAAVDDMDQLFADWEAAHPKSYAVNQYKTFKLASGKTTREILVSTAVLLGNYFDLDACTNLTYTDDMELEKLGSEQKVVIYIITPEGDTTFNWLAACLYSQIFTLLYKKGEENSVKRGNDDVSLDVPVRLLIDEMANIGSIPNFNEKLSTMRKYKISAMPIFQSRSQLDGCFDKQAETMIENCDTMVFLGGAGEKTTKELSGKLGKETIKTFSYGQSYGKSGSSSDNRQEIAHDVLSPDEIARLRNDECLIWIRGLRPFCSKKYVYENHPNYKYTPEGASKKDKESHKWEYSIKKFQTIYSDDVIQAASVCSPSDPRYDLYRDPQVLKMVAHDMGIDIDVSKDLNIDGSPSRGPVFIGKRYQQTNKKQFLDANNLQKQIANKKKAGEQKKKAMGIEDDQEIKDPAPVNPNVQQQNIQDMADRNAGGKSEEERKHIEEIIKSISPDAVLTEEQLMVYMGQYMSDGEIRERFTLESQFASDFEYTDEDLPDLGEEHTDPLENFDEIMNDDPEPDSGTEEPEITEQPETTEASENTDNPPDWAMFT